MTLSMIVTLAIVVLMIAVIISDKLPFGAPPLIACALLVVCNQATVAQAFSGFIDKNVILIAGFMVAMAGLQKTTFIVKLKNILGGMAGRGGFRNYALLIFTIMLISNFIAGTAYYVLVLSIVATIPYNKNMPTSRIVLPAAMASGFGGWIPINVAMMLGIMASLLETAGVAGVVIPIGSYALARGVAAAACFIWAMVGSRLLPNRDIGSNSTDDSTNVAVESQNPKITKTQELIVYIGFAVILVSMVMLSSLPSEVGYAIPAVVAGVFLCTGIINFKEFLGQWFSPLIVMMAGVIGVAAAMSNCGLTALLGEKVVGILGSAPNPFVLVLVFTLLTSICSTFTGASFGSLFIFAPIGIAVCQQLGYNPTAIVFSLTSAAWINYIMPIDGMPAMAFGMGKYKLVEFWKFTIPLWLMHILLTAGMSVVLFPL